MGARHRPPQELTGLTFAGREVGDAVTRRQLATPVYERLCRGAYRIAESAEGDAPVSYVQRTQAFLAVLPERTVLVGRSAAWAAGRWEPLAKDPVEVNVWPSGSVKKRAGLRLSARTISEADVVATARGRATHALRTALDVARFDAFEVAVPVLDAIMHTTSLRQSDLLAALAALPPGRGRRRARAAILASDHRSESPRESLLRLLVIAAGLPKPVLQWEVPFDDGKLHLDLAWPDVKVALEYDGWPHHDAARRSRDLARHNALRAAGWVVIQVDASGFRHPEVFLAHLVAALSR